MEILDALQEAVKSAMTAKNELNQRIAENNDNWDRTSNLVKDAWSQLELGPHKFKVGQVVFTCDNSGITQDAAQQTVARDPKMLVELQNSIKEYLERVRLSYDEKMQP